MSELKFVRPDTKAPRPGERTQPKYEDQLLDPFRVAPHVWHVAGCKGCGDYLIDTGDGLILIDTPTPEFSKAMFAAIEKAGFDTKDIKWHFISHWHGDHDGCSADIKDASGCKIFMGSEEWQMKVVPPESVKKVIPDMKVRYYEPDVIIDTDEASFTLGNITIHTLKTPGHTPGALTFRFEDTDTDGTVYTCAMHGGLGVAQMDTIEGMKIQGIPPECRDKFIDQCLEMSHWDIDITLPSHLNHCGYLGDNLPSDKTDFKPFADKRVWPVMLLERRGYVMERRGEESNK